MWRKPTIDDLKASLSEIEIQACGQDEFEEKTLEDQLNNTIATVRGFVRSGRKCRMPDDETLIPDFLISPAMDVCAFNVLKRIGYDTNDSRKKAYDRGCSLLEQVGKGQIVPEDYGEVPSEIIPDKQTPTPYFRRRKRVLGRSQECGI